MASSPEKTLRRVISIASMDGKTVTFIAGLSTLLSILFFDWASALDWVGLVVGGVVTFAGIIELRGRNRLNKGDAGGIDWLVRAQVIILVTIWIYCAFNLFLYNEAKTLHDLAPLFNAYGASSKDAAPYVRKLVYLTYLIVMAVTLLFQGGLALYYNRRRPAVTTALAARTATPPTLPEV